MRLFFVVLLSVGVVTGSSSQPGRRIPVATKFSPPLSALSGHVLTDTVRVLALMVQFAPDSDPRTSGAGTFATSGTPAQIDPPPHDAAYFTGKLRFLENYFAKVSDGRVIIKADLFGSVVTLADSMARYSPPLNGPHTALAELAVNSWTAANDSNPSFPFSQYHAFIIFHAGVGKDINLISILGFDPTPNDLPSITLNLESMRELLGDPGFSGIPVNGGSFFIDNSILLPETETRILESGSVRDTLQLSINGLLAASFGSFLGLPDLFDTNTGRSGIGQFGLMDGASIFAFNGLFPPEPSAWEKVYLGWVTPIVVPAGTTSLNLPAVSSTLTDTIYKIPVTEREYFLIENRNRDPKGNGQRLTLIRNGTVVTKHFGRDTTGFFFYDLRAITGSLIDVEDYDWAIPGDMTFQGYEGGGILIWHIDENVIAANLRTNTVNADPDRRGVDLEEADGSQDIGVPYEFLQPGSGTQNGWPLDAWYQGNIARVYRNEFTDSSFPSARSASGVKTFISLRNFSSKSVRASAVVERGTSEFRPGALTQSLPVRTIAPPTVAGAAVVIPSDSGIFVFGKNGVSRVSDSTGLFSSLQGLSPLAVVESTRTFLVGAKDSTLLIWELADNSGDGIFDSVAVTTVAVSSSITTPPMILDSAGTRIVVVGDMSGDIRTIGLDGVVRNVRASGSGPIERIARGDNPGSVFFTAGGSLFRNTTQTVLGGGPWILASGTWTEGTIVAVAEKGGRRVLGFGVTGEARFDASVEDSISEVILSDVDRDGRPDIIVVAAPSLYAFNDYGTILDRYPKKLEHGNRFSGTPVVVDVDGDGYQDVVCMTRDGSMAAYSRDGRSLSAFPFQAAPSGESFLVTYETESGNLGFLAAGKQGALQAWETGISFSGLVVHWSGFLNDPFHANFYDGSGLPASPRSTEFLPVERVYNWPNPVYGTMTQIRYYTSEPARISVKIFDIDGSSITELKGESPGGIDRELTWDVRNIQSGIYLARLEATGVSARGSVVFKIAVVK